MIGGRKWQDLGNATGEKSVGRSQVRKRSKQEDRSRLGYLINRDIDGDLQWRWCSQWVGSAVLWRSGVWMAQKKVPKPVCSQQISRWRDGTSGGEIRTRGETVTNGGAHRRKPSSIAHFRHGSGPGCMHWRGRGTMMMHALNGCATGATWLHRRLYYSPATAADWNLSRRRFVGNCAGCKAIPW